MNVICLSYSPLRIIIPMRKSLCSFDFNKGPFSSLKELCKNIHIDSIFFSELNKFFVASKDFLYLYEYKDELILKKKIYIEDTIKAGKYDGESGRIYILSNKKLLLYSEESGKLLCSFENIRNIIVDNYRFYTISKDGFLMILGFLDYCIFLTKKHIKKCCELIWNYKRTLDFKFKGIFRNKYVYIVKGSEKEVDLVLIDKNSFLMEIIDISMYTRGLKYSIIIYNSLHLIVYREVKELIYFDFYKYEYKVEFLFCHHYYNVSGMIKFYNFNNNYFIRNKKGLFYLFNYEEKICQELSNKMKNGIELEKRIGYYETILYNNRNRIENDVEKRELSTCCICYENNVNSIFLPCGHICCCDKCETIDYCPFCREKILYKRLCFISTK